MTTNDFELTMSNLYIPSSPDIKLVSGDYWPSSREEEVEELEEEVEEEVSDPVTCAHKSLTSWMPVKKTENHLR